MSIVWGIELRDKVSPSANAAADAMGTAAQRAKALQSAMNSAQSALAKAQALGNAAGVRKAAADFGNFKEALHDIPPAAYAVAESSNGIGESLVGAVFKANLLSKALDAVGKAAYSGLKEGFDLAIDASENIKRLSATFDALGEDGAHAGKATIAMLRDLETQVPQNEATLASWARTLEGAGLTDLSQLRGALVATANAEALVEGGGEKVKNILAKLNEQVLAGGGKVKFSLASLAGTGVTETEFLRALGMTPANFAAAKKAGTLTGQQVSGAIVKALSTKGAAPLAAQMDELSTMSAKAADGLRRLFEDVDTGPLTDGLKNFFSVFDLANPSGQVLKATVTAAFNGIFRIARSVFELIRVGFLHTIILGLQVAIALKGIRKWFEEMPARVHAFVDAWRPALIGMAAFIATILAPTIGSMLVSAIGYAIAATVWWALTTVPAAIAAAVAWTASMAAAAVAVIAATWPLIAIAAAVALVSVGIYELVKHWDQVRDFFSNMASGAWQAGVSFVDGLVGGITSGISRAVGAATNLAKSTWNAMRDTLGIRSPSTKGFDVGADLGEGVALGQDSSQARVQASAAALGSVAADSVGMSTQASTGGARSKAEDTAGGGRASINVGGITINIDGAKAGSVQELRAMVEEEMAALTERLALMVGSAPQPA